MSFSGYKTFSTVLKSIMAVAYLIWAIFLLMFGFKESEWLFAIAGGVSVLLSLFWIWVACLTYKLDLNREKN